MANNHLVRIVSGAFLSVMVVGCATGPDKKKEVDSFVHFMSGDIDSSLNSYEEAHKQVEVKDVIYDLNKSVLLRLGGKHNLSKSTDGLNRADTVVDNWMAAARVNLSKDTNEFATYLLANKSRNTYEPKDYEKSFISYNLALNHFLDGRADLAMVSAKKMAERETVITRFNEKRVVAIQDRESKEKGKGDQVFSSVNEINGYPVNLLDSAEVSSLKNSYQNAAVHYLAGFIFESNGEPSLAAPGYRQALELKPGNALFAKSLADVDNKSTASNVDRATADVLVVLETGNVPRLSTHRSNITFNTKKGPRIVTIRLPTIGQALNTFKPNSVKIGSQVVGLHEAVNVDAMARKQLKDDMPGHVLKATTQAIIQIVAQEAAQAAAEKNKKNNNGAGGIFAALAVGAALSAGDADTRMWSSLPGRVWMGRAVLPKGTSQLVVPTPTGPHTVEVNIARNYQIVHVRTLGPRAIVTSQGGVDIFQSDPILAWATH